MTWKWEFTKDDRFLRYKYNETVINITSTQQW